MSKETQNNKTTQFVIDDVISRFSNPHGWIDYSKFNEWMSRLGFSVMELERHNMTDGEVHFRYKHKVTAKTFDFNGNYWNKESFAKVVEWLNQNEL